MDKEKDGFCRYKSIDEGGWWNCNLWEWSPGGLWYHQELEINSFDSPDSCIHYFSNRSTVHTWTRQPTHPHSDPLRAPGLEQKSQLTCQEDTWTDYPFYCCKKTDREGGVWRDGDIIGSFGLTPVLVTHPARTWLCPSCKAQHCLDEAVLMISLGFQGEWDQWQRG